MSSSSSSTPSESETATETGRASDSEPSATARDRGNEIVAVLPYLDDLTYDELHAAYLGTCGLLVGLTYAAGEITETISFTLAVVGGAFGIRALPEDIDVPLADQYQDERTGGETNLAVAVLAFLPWIVETAAARTVRKEPWYFLILYISTFLMGVGLAVLYGRAV